jgi:transposase
MSAITLTHKIRLDPTCKQENYFRQACGVARFTWNWALAQWKKQYEAGKLNKLLRKLKKLQRQSFQYGKFHRISSLWRARLWLKGNFK